MSPRSSAQSLELRVGIEAALGLSAHPTHPDVLLEQRRRPVPRVLILLIHPGGHVMDDIQADEIAQGEGTHWVVEAELDDAVDVFHRRHPTLVGADSVE